MKPAAGKLLLVLAVRLLLLPLLESPPAALSAPAAARAQTPPPAPPSRATYDLLAHGNNSALWVAEVLPNNDPLTPGTRTIFRYRRDGDGANWRPLRDVAARAVALSDRGDELVVLLESGDWIMLSDSGARSGPSLPGQGNILALAGNADQVWAVGEDLRPPNPATAPATGPSAPATGPTTGPTTQIASTRPTTHGARSATTSAPVELGLFTLQRGQWTYQSELPAGVRANDIASMTLVDQRPLLAVISSRDQQLRLYSFASGGDWSDPITLGTLPPDAEINLENLSGRPIAAITDRATAATTIIVGGATWPAPIKLETSPEAADMHARTVAAGLGQLRLIASSGPGKMIEQPYDLNGKLAGKAIQSAQAPTFSVNGILFVLEVLAMVVLLGVMFGTLRRRAAIQQAARHLDQLHIAPISHRFAAGLIDAAPLIIAYVIAFPPEATPETLTRFTAAQLLWIGIGLAVYLLHTTAGELFAGRTIGKAMFGMRVTGLDGNRAGPGAILIRNLLRVVDIAPMLIPLLVMIFLPLRQRLGDLAAGTLVVSDQAPEPDEDDESEEA